MIKKDIRLLHEKEFQESNIKPISVCKGSFYISNQKRTIVCKNCFKCAKNKRYRMNNIELPQVKFRHVDSFRECELYKQIINEDYIRVVSTFCALYSNDLACNSIVEFWDDIKHQDKKTRTIFDAMLKRLNRYENKIKNTLDSIVDVDSLANFNDLMNSNVLPIVERLKKLVLNEFNSKGIENSEFISKVEISRFLIKYSVESIKTRIKEGRIYGVDLLSLQDYQLNELNDISKNFSDWVERNISDVNLATEEYIKTFKEIDRKITSSKILSTCIEQTINNVKY